MPLDHVFLKSLFEARPRLNARAVEDNLRNAALKTVTQNVSFEHNGALNCRAKVSINRETIDWLRKRKPESLGLDSEVLDLINEEWPAYPQTEGLRTEERRHPLPPAPRTAGVLQLVLVTTKTDGSYGGNFECTIDKTERQPRSDGRCEAAFPWDSFSFLKASVMRHWRASFSLPRFAAATARISVSR